MELCTYLLDNNSNKRQQKQNNRHSIVPCIYVRDDRHAVVHFETLETAIQYILCR